MILEDKAAEYACMHVHMRMCLYCIYMSICVHVHMRMCLYCIYMYMYIHASYIH